jgi:hypothetical protein
MPTYIWNVFTPEADLPHAVETSYLLTEGEEIEVAGRTWLVARVEIADEPEAYVMQAHLVAPTRADV